MPVWRARLGEAGHAAWKFLGPVAGSVRYRLSDPECYRVATKMVVTWVTTTGVTVGSLWHDPENLTQVIVPVVAAVLVGIFDAAMHVQSGAKPPDPPPPPPDETHA